MTSKNLLVELFVEELPPKALKKLGESFAGTLAASLKAQALIDGTSVSTPFASPRRLAVHVTAVAAKAADRQVQQKLMPVAVALDAAGQRDEDRHDDDEEFVARRPADESVQHGACPTANPLFGGVG